MKFIRTGFIAVDIFFKNYTLGCFVLKGGWGVAYIPDCFHGVKGVTHVQQCTVSQTMSWELSLKVVVTKYNKDCYVHALTPKFMWVGIILKIRYILFIHLLLLTTFKNFSS